MRCDNFAQWDAILYADPDRSGGRYYLSSGGLTQYLDGFDFTDKISSVYLRPGITLDYSTTNDTADSGWGRIVRDYAGQYTSTAGGADNTPEHWLQTNDSIKKVSINEAMPFYIQRHGATDDGINITSLGAAALQNAWSTVDCRSFKDVSLYYLSAANDAGGTQRYIQTAQIVQQSLQSRCPGLVSLVPMPVAYLSNFSAAQANAVMNQIKTTSDFNTRIYVLGSALLHKFMLESDCGSTPCYLQQWSTFMTLWNASWSLQTCHVGSDYPDNRQFMYNNVYRLQRVVGNHQNLACVSSIHVPLDSYNKLYCETEQANYSAANTCPPSALVSTTNSGTKLTVTVNNQLTDEVTVVLLDGKGDPVPNIPVQFQVLTGSGTLVTPKGKTDAKGKYKSNVKKGAGTTVASSSIGVRFDSSGSAIPDTPVVFGNPATVTFAAGG